MPRTTLSSTGQAPKKTISATGYPVNFSIADVDWLLDEALQNAKEYYSKSNKQLFDVLQELYRDKNPAGPANDFNAAVAYFEQKVRAERLLLDAFNKHRFEAFPNGGVDHDVDEEPIAFPLRFAAMENRIYVVNSDPISQMPGYLPPDYKYIHPPQNPKPDGKGKLIGASSATLGFPNGNITLAEIIAFMPHSIKSWDVVDRMVFNGANNATLTDMMHYYRHMPRGEICKSSVYKMMKMMVEKRGATEPQYKDWTIERHRKFPLPQNWDHDSVSVAGFRVPPAGKDGVNTRPDRVLFRDMRIGVKVMPSGFDALDLTRMVQWCVWHRKKNYYFPDHFEMLRIKLLKGGAVVQPEHSDEAVLRRHGSEKQFRDSARAAARQHDARGRLMSNSNADDDDQEVAEEDEADFEDFDVEMEVDGEQEANDNAIIPNYPYSDPKGKGRAVDNDDFDDDYDDDEYTPPRIKRKTPRPSTSRSRYRRASLARTSKSKLSQVAYAADEDEDMGGEEVDEYEYDDEIESPFAKRMKTTDFTYASGGGPSTGDPFNASSRFGPGNALAALTNQPGYVYHQPMSQNQAMYQHSMGQQQFMTSQQPMNQQPAAVHDVAQPMDPQQHM